MFKNDFIETIYNKELNANIKGFFQADKIKILQEGATKGTVMQGMEYRPDKVAAYYLGDETMSWAISLANNFLLGIEDYYLGREILIPTKDAFIKLTANQ
jgi:hypothetical protein